MKLRTNFMMIAAATTGVFTLGSIAVASADTTASTTKDIPRTVIHADRMAAEAKVLGISTDTLKADHKAHTIKQARTAKGLSVKQYRMQVKADSRQELTAQGYSAAQISQAQARHQYHMHHKA